MSGSPDIHDDVLNAIRHSIGRRFGHVLSPHSPTSPPDLPSSVIPLLDIDGKAEAAARRRGNATSSEKRQTMGPSRTALASPRPPSRASSSSSSSSSSTSTTTTATIQHPALATNRILHYDAPAPTNTTAHALPLPQPTPRLPASNTATLPAPPSAASRVHINRHGHAQIIRASPPKPSPVFEPQPRHTNATRSTSDFSIPGPPTLGHRHSHQPTAAAMPSGELLSELFSSKLIPSHTPSSPTSTPTTMTAITAAATTTSTAFTAAANPAAAAAIRSSGFEALIRKRCAYLGHRSEIERYASLLALRDMLIEQKKTHPHRPLPLPDVVLGSAVVMLDQAPLRAPPADAHSPRCHAICLEVMQLFGAQGQRMVPRLSSLLQRLWARRARVANGMQEGGDSLWEGVSPRWVVDAIVATGISGIDELLRLCSDGYGAKDGDILSGIVQHPAVQQVVVAVALADELGHPDMARSKQALHALVALGKRATGTTADLQAMLEVASVKPALVCAALSATSPGETVLMQALSCASRSAVRAAAAAALGYKYGVGGSSSSSSDSSDHAPAPNNTVQAIAAAAAAASQSNPGALPVRMMVTAQICNNCDINSHMNSTATATMGPVATQDAPVTLTADRRTGQKTIVVDGRHLLGSLLSLRRIQNGQRDESWFYPWARFTGIKIPDDARSVEEVPNDVLACLYHALGDDAEGVRATALVAMSMCSSAPSLAGRGMIGKLVGCMGDASGEVRAAAAEAIGRLGPDVLPYCQGVGPVNGRSNSSGMMLPAHLSSAPQTPTRRLRLDRVTDSTPVGGGSTSTSAMVRYSQHRNTTRSSRAPGFTPGSTRFRRARQPPDSSVTKSARKNSNSKNNAAERYAPPSDNAVLACLQTMLQDRLHCVRHAACIAIGHLGAAANEIAMDLLRVMDQGKVTRGVGGRALVKLAPTGQQLLLDLLCNARCQTKGGEKTRIAAAVGLGCMREDATLFDATVRVLFDVCRDPKPGVRAAALYALGKLGVKTEERVLYLRARSLLPFVYSHLRDKDKVVRLAAAKVLARAAPQGEMLLIEGLLQDKEEKVRVAITHGLSVVGPACIRTMMLALSDRSDAVREAAANVILGFGAEMIAEELKKRSSASRESLAHEIRALVQDTRKAFPAELDQLFLVLVGRIQGFTVYG